MLPPFLADTYHRYKQDTNDIATWLATTAKRLGFSADLLDCSSAPKQVQKSQRLKGKARKDAKKTSTISSNGVTDTAVKTPPTYTIAVKDFITLAEYIAPKQDLDIPTSIWSTLERSIRLRETHSDFHLQQTGEQSIESNLRHTYFLGVLEKVRDVLRPRLKSDVLASANVASTSSTSKDAESRLHNMFQGLSVEEPSEAFLNAPDITINSTTESTYVMEQVDDPLELYLGISALLEDCSRIRTALRHIWTNYKHGATSLTAAAATSNTAILLIDKLEARFLQDFPSQSTTFRARQTFFAVQCTLQGEDPGSRVRNGDPINLRPYELLEVSLMVSGMLVEAFQDDLNPRSLPLYKPGFFGIYNPATDRSSMTGPQKFDEDKVVLLEVMFDIITFDFSYRKVGVMAVDAFSRAVGLLNHGGKRNLALDFAAQIHLDIQHILRNESASACNQFRLYAQHATSSLNLNFKFHGSVNVDTWPKENDQVLKALIANIKGLAQDDLVGKTKVQKITQAGGRPDTDAPPFAFYNSHPWLCGSLLFGMKLDMQAAGVGFLNAWGSVKYSAHLYNAVRVEKFLEQDWKDMELALSFFSPANIFIGDAPNTLDDCFKHFCLNIGYSAQNYARGGRRPGQGAIISAAGPRGSIDEKTISPVAYELRYGYSTFDDSGRTEPNIEEVFQRCLEESDDAFPTPMVQANSERKSYTPHELLVLLSGALTQEELPLTFDLFQLHRFAWRLLRAVKEDVADDLRRIYGPDYIENESQLPFVVGYILMTAVQTKRFGKLLLPKKEDIVSSKLLQVAGKQLKEMAESGAGAMVINIMRKEYGIEVDFE